MDPNSVLDELAAIGVFDVPKPSLNTAPVEKARLDEAPVLEKVPVGPDTERLVMQSIQHAEGLLKSLQALQHSLNRDGDRSRIESTPAEEGSEPNDVLPPVANNSPAYQAALDKAMQKIRGEAHLVEEAPPVQRVDRTGFIRPPSPDGETDVFVGSSASRVRPADPSEFVSVGKG